MFNPRNTHSGQGPVGALGAAGAVTVALLWAICYPLVTTAVQYAPPLHIGSLRAFLAGSALVVLSIGLGRPRPRGLEWLAVVAIGASSTGLGFAGMFLAGGQVSPGIATVIANTQPLMAALIGYFVLGESLRGWQAVGMSVAFAGIALVAAPTLAPSGSTSVSLAGIGYVLLGAIGVAVGNVVMKRFAARLDAISATGWQLLVGSALLAIGASFVEPPDSIQWTVPFVLALAGLAIPGTAVAFALWFALIRRAPLNSLNVFSFLTPVFAIAIGTMFYDEHFGLFEMAGSGLVIAGAWIAARSMRTAHDRESASSRNELLYFEETGTGERAIVFLPGILGSTNFWKAANLDALGKDARLIYLDELGFGRSPWPAVDYTLEDHLAAIRKTLVARGATSHVTVVAHSFGAILAAYYASRYPNEVEALYLFGTPVYSSEAEARRGVGGMSGLAGLVVKSRPLARVICAMHNATLPLWARLAPYMRKDVPPNVASDGALHFWPSLVGSVYNVILTKPIEAPLRRLEVRVTFVHGDLDTVTEIGRVRALAVEIGATRSREDAN